MIEFRQVLCPIDFSDTSERALATAAALARRYESRLTVLYVSPRLEELLPFYVLSLQSDIEPGERRRRVLDEMRQLVDRTGVAALDPALVEEQGRPPEAIVRLAESLPADLIVMGTHGRSGLDRLLLGSVAESVLQRAPCPVLTVPPRAADDTATHVTFKQIICGVDFSPSSTRALDYALELARQSGGCVTIVHAIEYMELPDDPEYVDPSLLARQDQLVAAAGRRLHALVAGEPQTGCKVKEVVAINRAYRELLLQATAAGADLIVMGVHGHGIVDRMIYGSNTQHVLRRASCPVLTVRGTEAR